MCGTTQVNLYSSQSVKEICLLIMAKCMINVLYYMVTSYGNVPDCGKWKRMR